MTTKTKPAPKKSSKKSPKKATTAKKSPKAKREPRQRDPNKIGMSHLHILRALQGARKGLTATEIRAALPKDVNFGIYLWSRNPEVAAAWEAKRGPSCVARKLVKPQDDEERGVVYHITDLGREAIKKNKDK